MTDVTENRGQAEAELSAVDEQVLRERARAGGLKLTGAGQDGAHRGRPVEITVPRDRDSSFEPKIVAKRQRRLTGIDELVISLSAKRLTHGEIAAHLAEVYGA